MTYILPRIRHVQKTIFILELFVNRRHERSGGWQDLVYIDEDGLLWL